jgi:ABC-type bacteriocin/lantibiotic exporter with double-glycine peptidase domain
MYTLGPLWVRAPSLALVLLTGLVLSGAEGFATGWLARGLNLAVRQSLGRMFGFSLDVWSKVDAVGALGLESRLVADYRSFAADYFENTFKLNTLLVFHRCACKCRV